jgi:hypothetical protein
VLGVLVAVVLPGGALGAKTRTRKYPATVETRAHFGGSHGYRFVYIDGSFGPQLIVRHISHGAFAITSYSLRGDQPGDPAKIDMKLGDEGHLRGHFVSSSTAKVAPQQGCTGDGMKETGAFVGSFDFHGEDGFSRAHLSRIQGSITRAGPYLCREPKPPPRPKPEREREPPGTVSKETSLIAGTASGELRFEVQRTEGLETEAGSDLEDVIVSTFRHRARLEVSSLFAAFFLKSAALITPNPLNPRAEEAATPPGPYFSGSATFKLEGPRKASWTGDLAVDLPGVGPMPLTGPKVAAGVCVERSHCTKTLPPALLPGRGGRTQTVLITGEAQ